MRVGMKSLVTVDFFTVPTLRFQILYVFLALAHERRRILHFGVTAHPTAEWTAPTPGGLSVGQCAPLRRDRDRVFGQDGNPTSVVGPALALAARVCGTGDRHDSARVPRSRDRFQSRPACLAICS